MTWKDSGGQERAQASGEVVSAPAGARTTCDKCPRRHPGPVYHQTVACPECGKEYARCAGHGGLAGAMRSLHSHRALYHPKTEGGRPI